MLRLRPVVGLQIVTCASGQCGFENSKWIGLSERPVMGHRTRPIAICVVLDLSVPYRTQKKRQVVFTGASGRRSQSAMVFKILTDPWGPHYFLLTLSSGARLSSLLIHFGQPRFPYTAALPLTLAPSCLRHSGRRVTTATAPSPPRCSRPLHCGRPRTGARSSAPSPHLSSPPSRRARRRKPLRWCAAILLGSGVCEPSASTSSAPLRWIPWPAWTQPRVWLTVACQIFDIMPEPVPVHCFDPLLPDSFSVMA